FARELRLALWREHLDWDVDHPGAAESADSGYDPDALAELVDPEAGFAAFAKRAQALDEWVAGGRQGPRPPGRVRPHSPERLSRFTRMWSAPVYHAIYDPDGRPRRVRRAGDW
nr:hypothetical protein [Micromonospora sp. DSM 115978]